MINLKISSKMPQVPKVRIRVKLKIRRANGPWRVRVCFAILDPLYSLNIFDNGRRPGSPGDQSIPLGYYSERCFRPLAPHGSIFIDFLTTQNDIEKTMIFRILKNRPKWQNQSTLERPRSVFRPKTYTFGLPFGINFSTFSENGESVL